MVLPFLNVTKSLERGFKHIGSLVEERKRLEERYGKDFQDRPVRCVFFSAMTPLGSFREQNDILTWLAEISKGRELTTREMTSCILIMNFVAIHTTTMARKPTVAHKTFIYVSCRLLRIRYMTWQLIRNTFNRCVKKSKQLSR